VSNAEDPAARQAVIGKADGLVNQFITTDRYLRDQEKQINTAIVSNVEMINNYSKQIANLNDQISRLTGVGGGVAPNDLLDRRDQLVSELNTIVGVEVNVQDGGTYNVTMANGYSLVQGDRANQLAAVPSNADPSRTTVAFVDSAAGNIEIPEKFITNGSLGGLLKFRSEDLDQTRNALGQMALAFADAFNAQHKQGVDANGDDGGDFFAFGKPSAIGNAKNGGSAVLTPEISNSKQVQATDYKLVYDGSAWQVTRLADNTSFTVTPGSDGKLEFDGMKIAVSGDADRNDSFVVKPVSDAVIDMKVLVRNESQLAMAFEKDSGESDNRNGQALLDLQKEKIVGGSKSFNDAWATLVSDIGNKTSTLKTSSETQEDVVEQLTANQQSSAGVNLDEEYGHLIHYQQFYMASAQVLQTASSLFDALLNIR
jgi:flagellar hook-associated protein 1 FlgK